MNKKEELYYEFEYLRVRMETLQKQMEDLENRRIETLVVIDNLDDLKNNEGKEILIPLGAGVYFKGKVDKMNKVLVSVGANVIVKKDVKEAKRMLEKEIKNIEAYQNELQREMEAIILRLEKIENELNKLE